MSAAAATVLIVDDDSRNRALLEVLLQPEGYAIIGAGSGEDALRHIAANAPDLILLDVLLPGMDGHELTRVLKAAPATANIPIIMVTARTDRAARLAGLESGAEDFLTKPVDRVELWLRVRNLLRLKTLGDMLLNNSADLERQVQDRTTDLQRFRSAMDATADAIVLVNQATMEIIEVNATACAMLGYTRAELLRKTPAQLSGVSPEEYARIYEMVGEIDLPDQLAELSLVRPDGARLQVEVRRHAMSAGGDRIIVAVMRDITVRKEAEERLHRLAHYDALTGLPNRTLFYDTLTKTVARTAERHLHTAVLFIDVDRFKGVNDTLGHAAGDELLRRFAERLVGCVRVRDTVGRLGGDEFAVILTMEEPQQGAATVVGKIRDALAAPFVLNDQEIAVTASIGVTIHPDDAQDAASLIKFADTAMYRAKQAGRDTYRFFTAKMNEEVLARIDLEGALRQALENGEFLLYYQPKIDLSHDRIIGYEALLRWDRPGHGLIAPGEFIPILEECGLIVAVGRWVLAAACEQIGTWLRSGGGALPIAVNVSSRQFTESDLEGDIARLLDRHGIPPDLLELELTESTLMINTEATLATLRSLKARGVEIAIDDFGTGYSSLAYLRRFTIDKVKIDTSFIRDITTVPDAAAIVLAIIRMAHSLRLKVVAEGVETAGQLALLRRYDCDQVQGYHFSRPVPVAELGGDCKPAAARTRRWRRSAAG